VHVLSLIWGWRRTWLLLGLALQPLVSHAANTNGPTIRLDYGLGAPQTNAVSEFMYFVPLISPEPVLVVTNPGHSLGARVLSLQSRTNAATFTATCEFEFEGDGSLQNIFDHTNLIQHHETQLNAGDVLARQLSGINVEGAGRGTVEVSGNWTNGQPRVNELRLKFNAHGHASPVTINLQDIARRNGKVVFENEMVARINTLAFRRTPGQPKMEVTLDSLKRKDASDSGWQHFVGSLKGSLVNLFIPPLNIEAEGQQAMLDFGRALATRSPKFTFPYAARLKSGNTPAPATR
jgi:hypothetical protein